MTMLVASSLYKFWLLAFVPGIVGQGEADAIWDCWVGIEHEDCDGTGGGVGEIHFAENLKGLRGNLAGIRNQAVGDFQAILIRLVFHMAAEGALHGVGDKGINGNQKQQRGERGPIVNTADAPGVAESLQQPTDSAETEIEEDE